MFPTYLTQQQADAMYTQQWQLEMRAIQESRIINFIQGVAALLMIILVIRSLIKK